MVTLHAPATAAVGLVLSFTVTGCMFRQPADRSDPIVTNPLAQASACSMLGMGSDIGNAPSPPVPRPPGVAPAPSLCCEPTPERPHPSHDVYPPERRSTWVSHDGAHALVTMPNACPPRGVVVVFAGLGMSPEAPILRDIADRLAGRGFVVARKLREEAYGELRLDPLTEARTGIVLGERLAHVCGVTKPVTFAGMSLGGAEALLAGREAPDSPVVVIDPLLDVDATVRWLRRIDLTLSRDVMLEFFRLVIHGRYGVRGTLGDAFAHANTGATKLDRDMPVAWLPKTGDAWWRHVRVFLSAWDPVLGEDGRERLDEASVRHFEAEGHIGVYCESDGMSRVVEAMAGCAAGVCE
jgi:hypothetical protein